MQQIMKPLNLKISKEKVCCISDLHFGTHQDSPIWHRNALKYAFWLRDKLRNQNIKDILILGDINNNRNEISVPTINMLPKFFRILSEFNIIIVVGNHDCFYNKRSDVHSIGTLSEWENINVIDKPTTITAFGKTLTLCPWETDINKLLKSDIILGHFEIQSFKIRQRKICEKGILAKDILKKAPLIVSGHFHISEVRKYEIGEVIYLGCPYQLDWNDYMDMKGYYILDIPTSTYTFFENNFSPKHIKVNLSELLAAGITDKLKKEFKGNIVKFHFDKDIPQEAVEKVINKLSILEPLDIKFEFLDKDNIIDNNTIDKFEGVDIENSFIEFVKLMEDVEFKDETINYILDIYARVKAERKEIISEVEEVDEE